jgi:prepilin signal peptidase PulO-like enzyme (type II secretory pathway)
VSIFFIIFLFFLGLFFGSFLNLLIDRLPNNKSILGRSHCEKCHKTLTWKDLIPLLSFIHLRGKCRYCHTKLSFQYPLLELVTGGLFALTYIFTMYQVPFIINSGFINPYSLIINLLFNLFIVSCFIVIFFADLKYGIIPDKIIVAGILVTLPYIFMIHDSEFMIHLLSAFGAFLFFLLLYLLTRGRGMGFGDVKLAFLLGLVLGFPGVFYAIYIAFLTGGLAGIILILWKKKTMKSSVPFGPFLIIGAFISLFFTPLIAQIIADLL